MFLLRLAFLNIGRNRRRSLITISAVSVGLAALVFLWGYSDGTTEQQRENVIRLFTGHVQIHAAAFEKKLSPELTLPNRTEILQKLEAASEVRAITERVKCEALIGTSENSRGVLLIGIDPVRELQVTAVQGHILKGEFLTSESKRELLVGDRLAKKIEIEAGDKVVVMTQAIDGTLAGYSYLVKGIFHTGSQQIDELTIYAPLKSAQELLGLGSETHEIVLRLSGRKAIPPFLTKIKTFLKPDSYEILSWDQIIPEVNQWATWSEAIIRTILFTVTVVIGVGIMNTILMSIYERTKELGVMLAIGTSPTQVISLILLETFLLEICGIVLGLIAGYLLNFYFGRVGIAFHGVEEAFSSSYMSTVTYTKAEFRHVVQSVLTLMAITTFIGLYPAWKAGRMEPVKAIYHS